MTLFDRKDLAAIEGGQWVSGNEVPALASGRLKVRGFTSDASRDAFAYKARAASAAERHPDGQLKPSTAAKHTREVLAEACIMEAEGLGFTAEEIREMVLDPACENLILACMDACTFVDQASGVAKEALSGN